MAKNSKKKKLQEKEEGLPIWMATFADMMTLLFAFFVLLFSMSTIDPVKVSAMQDAMVENTTAVGGAAGQAESKPLSVNEIKKTLTDIINNSEDLMKNGATVTSDPRGVILELDGEVCFKGLSADVQNSFLELLVEIKEKVMSHPHDKRTVIIEGHTDNESIPLDELHDTGIPAIKIWPTNRHLSGARAAAVVNALSEEGFCLPVDDVNQELVTLNNRANDIAGEDIDINQMNCGVNQLWFAMGVKPSRLVSAGYGEFWPFGEAWANVKAKHFGDDKCFVQDKEVTNSKEYKYIKAINQGQGTKEVPIKVIQNFKEVTEKKCVSKQGYWGNEIDFLNTTNTQRTKNRRVKIIFSKN